MISNISKEGAHISQGLYSVIFFLNCEPKVIFNGDSLTKKVGPLRSIETNNTLNIDNMSFHEFFKLIKNLLRLFGKCHPFLQSMLLICTITFCRDILVFILLKLADPRIQFELGALKPEKNRNFHSGLNQLRNCFLGRQFLKTENL